MLSIVIPIYKEEPAMLPLYDRVRFWKTSAARKVRSQREHVVDGAR